jgi:hypothetical protein
MGEVYLARDRELQVDVAIKVPKSLNAEAQEQFLREARALAKVQHRNIVAIRKFDRCGDYVYFVMDVVLGPNAARLVRLFGEAGAHRLSGADVLRIASVEPSRVSSELREIAAGSRPYHRLVALWIAEAAEGLDAAHAAGIYHRDVKPDNLLLAPDGRLLVADFGLAKSSKELPRGDGLGVTGTFPYIAPERAVGNWARVDHRADIWALGATLYEFLAYERAYSRGGGRDKEVLKDIVSKDPVLPRQKVSAVPRELERICLKAMRRDPDQRYQTAAEMAADLRGFLNARRWHDRPTLSKVAMASILLLAMCSALAWPAVRLRTRNPVERVIGRFVQGSGRTLAGIDVASDMAPPKGESPSAAAPAPSLASDKPVRTEDRLEKAPLFKPVILLACNQDLNTDDEQPPKAGGEAERVFPQMLADSGIEVRDPLQSTQVWDEKAVLEEAGKLGVACAIFCTAEARVIERSPRSEFLDFDVDRWEVTVRARIYRRDAATQWLCRQVAPRSANNEGRARGPLYGGSKIAELARDSAREVIAAVGARAGEGR